MSLDHEDRVVKNILTIRRCHVTGLEAISSHNGWSIAAVGISIVFTGLTVLSIIISQLHKALNFWDERGIRYQQIKEQWQKKEDTDSCVLTEDIEESARQFNLLTDRMGEPFSLPKLLELSKKCGMHPHSAINDLLLKKRIVPDGKGYYSWNK